MAASLRRAVACGLAVAASTSFGAGELPRSDDFELSGLAYVLTELEACASLSPDLMRRFQAILARDAFLPHAIDEFHADPHHERFRREILQRQALASQDRVELECTLMLTGFAASEPAPH